MATNTDLLKRLARRWVGQIGAAGVSDAVVTTIPLSSTTNLPTTTAVVLTIDRVNPAGTATPSLEETIIGVVSATNVINSLRGAEGTAQAHVAGAVVEVLVTAKGYNDIIDHLLISHTQLGYISGSAITASMISASAITAGRISASAVVAGNMGFSVTTPTSTETATNKRITRRLFSTTSTATLTPEISTYDEFALTAQAAALTIANHSSSTPADGDKMIITITPDATPRALTFGTAYVAKAGVALPTTTTASKTLVMGFRWDAGLSKWNLLASGVEN